MDRGPAARAEGRPATGPYRVTLEDLPPHGTAISRGNVAHFMLQQATSDAYVSQAPAIAC